MYFLDRIEQDTPSFNPIVLYFGLVHIWKNSMIHATWEYNTESKGLSGKYTIKVMGVRERERVTYKMQKKKMHI